MPKLMLQKKWQRWILTILGLMVLLLFTITVAATVGPASISAAEVAQMVWWKIFSVPVAEEARWPGSHEIIVFQVRLPRIVLGAIVGGALAVAGTTFQGLLKNPMADPYIIGVSAGASVGAALGVILRSNFTFLGLSTVSFLAFAGAVVTTFVVYNIARVGNKVPMGTLLLAGVAVGSFLSAIVSFLMVIGNESLHEIVFWLMGSLSAKNWDHVRVVLPYVALGGAVIIFHSRDLNLMLLGEESAQHLGVDVERAKAILLTASSLMAAAAVSVSGIIGFVGLIIPHAVRLLTGPDHRILLPAAGLVGAIFLVFADTVARTVLAPTELPVGVITAMCGAPFFLYLLRKRKGVG